MKKYYSIYVMYHEDYVHVPYVGHTGQHGSYFHNPTVFVEAETFEMACEKIKKKYPQGRDFTFTDVTIR